MLVLSVYLLLVVGGWSLFWLLCDFLWEYWLFVVVLVVLLLFGWFWSVNLFSDGVVELLFYLLLVNLLELGLLIVLFVFYCWSDVSLVLFVDGNVSVCLGC